jgi:hypothetical protein
MYKESAWIGISSTVIAVIGALILVPLKRALRAAKQLLMIPLVL